MSFIYSPVSGKFLNPNMYYFCNSGSYRKFSSWRCIQITQEYQFLKGCVIIKGVIFYDFAMYKSISLLNLKFEKMKVRILGLEFMPHKNYNALFL